MIDITGIKFIIVIIIAVLFIWGTPYLVVTQISATLVVLTQFALLYYYGEKYTTQN